MCKYYDNVGNELNDIDKSRIIAIHKFDLNKFQNYNFNDVGIRKSIFIPIVTFNENDEIFEIYYLLKEKLNTKRYFLITKIGNLDVFIEENFNEGLTTIHSNNEPQGKLYIKKDNSFGENKSLIEKAYIIKQIGIVQLASKSESYDGCEKFHFNIQNQQLNTISEYKF